MQSLVVGEDLIVAENDERLTTSIQSHLFDVVSDCRLDKPPKRLLGGDSLANRSCRHRLVNSIE
jgi:hypothetical protein